MDVLPLCLKEHRKEFYSISKRFSTEYPHFSFALCFTPLEAQQNPHCTPMKTHSFSARLCKPHRAAQTDASRPSACPRVCSELQDAAGT